MWDVQFFLNSALLGLGLAMDAFSVSMANGLNEPLMKKRKMFGVAGLFGFFQGVMPMIGWFLVHSLVSFFSVLEKFIPWTALALLSFIGIKMIVDGVKQKDSDEKKRVGFWGLIVQGVATSIDALSVGLTIAEYNWLMALVCASMIMVITFALCVVGVLLGKKFGTWLSNKATIFGGVILILIGIEICLSSLLGW